LIHVLPRFVVRKTPTSVAMKNFVEKIEKAGFGEIAVRHREPVSVDDLALYPLFTPEVLQLMRTLITRERQTAVATSVVITARQG